MQKDRSKDVDVTVPEPRGHHKALAIDDLRSSRDGDFRTRPHGKNASVVYKDGAVFDDGIYWRRVYLRAGQG